MSKSRLVPLLLLAGGGYWLYTKAKAQAEALAATNATAAQAAQAAQSNSNMTLPGLGRLGIMKFSPRTVLSKNPARAFGQMMRTAGFPDAKVMQMGTDRGAGVAGLGAWTLSKSSIENLGREALIAAIPIVGPSLVIKKVVQNDPHVPNTIKKIVSAAATMSIPIVGSAIVTQGAFSSGGKSVIGNSNTSVTGVTSNPAVTPVDTDASATGNTSGGALPGMPAGPQGVIAAPAAGGSAMSWILGGGAAAVGAFFMLKK